MLAVALLLAVLALIWFGGVSNLLDLYQERADLIAERSALATRLTQRAATLPELRARTASLAPQVQPPPLVGASDAEAAAGLQETLQTLATTANLTIGSIEILPASDDGSYRRIEVRLSITSDYPSLIALLNAIATSTTPLVVTGLDLTGPPRGQPSDTPSIDSVITVAGWRVAS
jgi:general secretion pathway protein M